MSIEGEVLPMELFKPADNYTHIQNGLYFSTFEKTGVSMGNPPDAIRVRDGDVIVEAAKQRSDTIHAAFKAKTPWMDCVFMLLRYEQTELGFPL